MSNWVSAARNVCAWPAWSAARCAADAAASSASLPRACASAICRSNAAACTAWADWASDRCRPCRAIASVSRANLRLFRLHGFGVRFQLARHAFQHQQPGQGGLGGRPAPPAGFPPGKATAARSTAAAARVPRHGFAAAPRPPRGDEPTRPWWWRRRRWPVPGCAGWPRSPRGPAPSGAPPPPPGACRVDAARTAANSAARAAGPAPAAAPARTARPPSSTTRSGRAASRSRTRG